ncbi:hypothetical protein [Luteibacter sp. SG786]|uniref:hypothetical protein n=1 Tax=Luteibacter sp. SG786 TaxID=2587130 RepID=UPI001420A7F6|nr:hypothetical protein [Luteibacter sp. SG786]NII54286.1 hypothetical protein [Luteibacter sp. SG786]
MSGRIVISPTARDSAPKSSQARTSQDLPLPSIDDAVNGRVPWSVLQQGLTLRVPRANFSEGDRIHVFLESEWEGSGFGQATTFTGSGDDAEDATVLVPTERAISMRASRVFLYYLWLAEGVQSGRVEYFVESPIYPAEVVEAVNGEIPIEAAEQGVTVRIPPYEGMRAGDVVSLYWLGSMPACDYIVYRTIGAGEVDRDIEEFIDSRLVAPFKSDEIVVVYRVSRLGLLDKTVGPPRVVRVAVEMSPPTGVYVYSNESLPTESWWPDYETGDETGYPMELELPPDIAVNDVVTCVACNTYYLDGCLIFQKTFDGTSPVMRFYLPLGEEQRSGVRRTFILVERNERLLMASRLKRIRLA